MSDIVERDMWLRSIGLTPEWFFTCSQRDHQEEVLRKAADLIERQAAEIEKLKTDMHTFYNRGFNEGIAFRSQQEAMHRLARGSLNLEALKDDRSATEPHRRQDLPGS